MMSLNNLTVDLKMNNLDELQDLLSYLKDLTDELEEALEELAGFELAIEMDMGTSEGGDDISE